MRQTRKYAIVAYSRGQRRDPSHDEANPAVPRAEVLERFRRDFAGCQFDALEADAIVDQPGVVAASMRQAQETFGGSISGALEGDVLVEVWQQVETVPHSPSR